MWGEHVWVLPFFFFLEWELSASWESKVNDISRGGWGCMYVFRHVYSLYLIWPIIKWPSMLAVYPALEAAASVLSLSLMQTQTSLAVNMWHICLSSCDQYCPFRGSAFGSSSIKYQLFLFGFDKFNYLKQLIIYLLCIDCTPRRSDINLMEISTPLLGGESLCFQAWTSHGLVSWDVLVASASNFSLVRLCVLHSTREWLGVISMGSLTEV